MSYACTFAQIYYSNGMNYKHIIFDIDGTLLDSMYADLHGLQDTMWELTHQIIPIDQLTFALGIPGEVALKRLGIRNTQSANKLWNKNFMKYKDTIKLFAGVQRTIQQLHDKGFQLGIVTSKTPLEFANDFEPHGISHYFDTVVCVTDSPRPKPYPDPILTYLHKASAEPCEAIYIGDTTYDCQCAHSAGIHFGLALWSGVPANGAEANYLLQNPDEILNLL